jgi:hypothetical protein
VSGYIAEWGHTYIVHLGVWVSLIVTRHAMVHGITSVYDSFRLVRNALVLGALVGLFSSHAHNHIRSHFMKAAAAEAHE